MKRSAAAVLLNLFLLETGLEECAPLTETAPGQATAIMSDGPDAKPIVSVALPTFRRPQLLERAIDSVIAQTLNAWELLVVDDNGVGTEDQITTERFMHRFAADGRIAYHKHAQNRGGGAARNTAIRNARGEFVAFLDDDDAWYPTKLQLQVEQFGKCKLDVAMVYGAFERVDERGTTLLRTPTGDSHTLRNLLIRNGIGTTSVAMVRRAALVEIGGFDETLPSKQDIDLYVRLAERHAFSAIPQILLEKHRHGGETIGTNYDATIRASELFYEKHRVKIVQDRGVHFHRLRSHGDLLLRAGRIREARRLLFRAWLQRPASVSSFGLAIVANRPLIAAYRFARKKLRRSGRTSPSHSE